MISRKKRWIRNSLELTIPLYSSDTILLQWKRILRSHFQLKVSRLKSTEPEPLLISRGPESETWLVNDTKKNLVARNSSCSKRKRKRKEKRERDGPYRKWPRLDHPRIVTMRLSVVMERRGEKESRWRR